MVRDDYRYALEMTREDGSALGQFPVTMDWEPAREWARFTALREGKQRLAEAPSPTTIEPSWHSSLGPPYVAEVRVRISANGTGEASVEVPLEYFKRSAQQVGSSLVEKKVLKAGERFNYSVLAFPGRAEEADRPRLALTVEEVAVPVRLREARLGEFYEHATSFGTQNEEDFPVFIPQSVLDEAAEMTRAAGAAEVGGILLGHECRDATDRSLFLHVTALICAKHTLQELTKLTFTRETWTAVDAAIALRRGDEQMVGWFHSHPAKFWCSPKCPPEARRVCPLAKTFFSGEDLHMHRTAFYPAHCVALVITNTDDGLRYATFGWRRGVVAQRGFSILNSNPETLGHVAEAEAIIGGNEHEKVCA